MPLRAGTSGWQYRDWREVFYPPGIPQRRWLEHYAGHYGTVENNGTFYRLPGRETFADWRARTPDGFMMAIKASRYLTHIRRLRDAAEPVARLLDAAAGLGDRLGPVLLQLPPDLPADPVALDACLAEFSRFPAVAGSARLGGQPAADGISGHHVRVAVEFRHPSWWTDEIRQLLERRQAALCWADRLGRPLTPLWRTADWGYLRFHEGTAQPWPRYDERTLRDWAQRAGRTWPGGADVFAYFNNDQGGAAPLDAAAFASIARPAGLQVAPAAFPGGG